VRHRGRLRLWLRLQLHLSWKHSYTARSSSLRPSACSLSVVSVKWPRSATSVVRPPSSASATLGACMDRVTSSLGRHLAEGGGRRAALRRESSSWRGGESAAQQQAGGRRHAPRLAELLQLQLRRAPELVGARRGLRLQPADLDLLVGLEEVQDGVERAARQAAGVGSQKERGRGGELVQLAAPCKGPRLRSLGGY
jgi:hypothetical protein